MVYSDNELAEKITERDPDAFTELYNRYWPALYLQINKITQDPDNALDILHSIFERLWLNFPNNIQNLQAYLYQTARHASINHINGSRRKEHFFSSITEYAEVYFNNTEETLQVNELTDILNREIANLPEKMREIFIRARINDEPHKKIAQDLGIHVNTVKTVLFRATKILRKKIPYIKIFFFQ